MLALKVSQEFVFYNRFLEWNLRYRAQYMLQLRVHSDILLNVVTADHLSTAFHCVDCSLHLVLLMVCLRILRYGGGNNLTGFFENDSHVDLARPSILARCSSAILVLIFADSKLWHQWGMRCKGWPTRLKEWCLRRCVSFLYSCHNWRALNQPE